MRKIKNRNYNRKYDTAYTPANNKKQVTAFLLGVIILLSFAFSVTYIGKLYLGDIVVSVIGLLYAVSLVITRAGSRLFKYGVGLICILAATFVLDLINHIPKEDLARGIARNAVFVAAIFAFFQLRNWFGLKSAMSLILCGQIAQSVASVLYTADSRPLAFLVKFAGAGSLVWLFILFIPYRLIQVLSAIVLSLVALLLLDARSAGAIGLGAVILFLFSRSIARFRKRNYILIGGLAAVILIPATISLLTSQSYLNWSESRQEMSNIQRLLMAESAYNGILEHPINGQGSWQHARQYVDKTIHNADDFIGVHSYILQFGFEYGMLGLAIGIALSFLGLTGIWSFAVLYSKNIIQGNMALVGMWMSLTLFYCTLFSGLAGYSRITVGLICGLLLHVHLEFQRDPRLGVRDIVNFKTRTQT